MIIIKYNDSEITALGHSGYAKPQNDIVCAGVSTAFKMTVGILAEYDIKFKFESNAESGFIGIQIDESHVKETKKIRNVLLTALNGISKEYPNNVKVFRTVTPIIGNS